MPHTETTAEALTDTEILDSVDAVDETTDEANETNETTAETPDPDQESDETQDEANEINDQAETADESDEDSEDEDTEADESDDLTAVLRKNRRANREAQKQRALAKSYRAQLDKYEAAAAAGLDLSLAVRLQGDTAEQLAADAEKLKTLFGSPTPPRINQRPSDGVERNTESHTPDLSDIGARIYRR